MQLSKLLGHHSPAFTLTVYAHLIDSDVGEPLDPVRELDGMGNKWATQPTETDLNGANALEAELAA